MANSDKCLFMGWNRPVTGRENNAVELFDTVTNFLNEQTNQGNIDSFEPCILGAHGGNLNGFFMIRGNADDLADLRNSDEFLELVTQCNFNLEGFGVVDGYINEGLETVMSKYKNNV